MPRKRRLHRLGKLGKHGLIAVSLLLIGTSSGDSASKEPAITTGTEAKARTYYTRISQMLGVRLEPGKTTLDGLLAFAGYQVSAFKVESLDSRILMDPVRAASPTDGLGWAAFSNGDILATRFFAPKIVNVSKDQPIPGWRKLVRLRTLPDSAAARVGIQSVIILFNFFADAKEQPFSPSKHSFNTQVMLIAPALKDRLYWLDFSPEGRLDLKLNASFDADLSGGSNRDYFIPDGCNACHGSPGNYAPPMVNYLDTDNWFDRLNDDFLQLKTASTPVVFDAGTNDTSQPSFAVAFEVIRQFNREALEQNESVHPESFETEAARTWIRIHAQSSDHIPPIARSFLSNGKPVWQGTEADGLGRLNRYCFRCHGSVRFSVFDRRAVVEKSGVILQRIRPSRHQAGVPGFKMPPDRALEPKELEALESFVKGLE